MVSAPSTGSGDARLERGRVLTETRAGDVLLLVLALANGLFLYVAPGLAEEHYAWPLAPPTSAAFLGAGYLAGVVATGLVLAVAQTWREFRMLAPARCSCSPSDSSSRRSCTPIVSAGTTRRRGCGRSSTQEYRYGRVPASQLAHAPPPRMGRKQSRARRRRA